MALQGADAAYERDKQLAADPDVAVRRELAQSRVARPEILYFLASDEAGEVRRDVAANPMTPIHAAVLLARDKDESVRAALALRFATTARGFVPDSPTPVDPRFFEVLDLLARDAVAEVRRTLAEAIKDAPHAPLTLIDALARDKDIAVAGPVLRLSPVLGQAQLLKLIAAPTAPGVLGAIAQRARLDAALAAQIAASGDEAAIAALLANPTAGIDEATLDRIAEQAPAHPAWHHDLVRRASLPMQVIRRLITFVAVALLRQLEQRKDLDGETRALIAAEIERRPREERTAPEPASETAAERVARLKGQGALDEAAVVGALDAGDRAFVKAALAALSGLAPAIVDKVFRAHSAKGIVAVAWKAGLSPRLATQIQLRLGGFPPKQALGARDGTWPLTPEEMTWHLEFFGA
jgi:uncharacterized protein (DUF2336 family)